jgi:beta-lactamase class A
MEDRMKRFLTAGAITAALAAFPAQAQTKAPPPAMHPLWAHLTARLQEVDRKLDGVLGVSLRDLKAGQAFDLRANEPFPTASAIKIGVLYELFRQAEEGRIDLAEITRPPMPRVEGGGILQSLGDRVSLTWRDLAVLMIGWSDNEATNVLIGKVGMDAVGRRMGALGVPGVRLRRKMMDLEAAKRGDENVATPGDLRRLMEIVAAGEGLSAERAKDLRKVAGQAESYSQFRTALPADVPALTKSGELDGVRTEVAYVDLPGRPYAIAVMTTWLAHDKDGEAAIREVSAAVYETMSRLSRSSEYGRVIQ